jgi:hypothetical protein
MNNPIVTPLTTTRAAEMKHVQVNGKPLCRAASEAYLAAIGERNEKQVCKCRYLNEMDAIQGANDLRKILGSETFTVEVVSGPCKDPIYICQQLSDQGTY